MTKTEIAKRLDELAIQMRSVALDMEYHSGFSPWSKHAKQMLAASFIAEGWAVEIRKEIEHDNIIATDSSHGRNRPPGNGAQKHKARKRKAKKHQPKAEGGIND